MVLRLKSFSSSDAVQHDKQSARNLMAIARMPEDCSKTFKHLQKPSKPYTPVCVYTCRAH
eukprot:5874383-Heterocapsa_arctica.AAC.1